MGIIGGKPYAPDVSDGDWLLVLLWRHEEAMVARDGIEAVDAGRFARLLAMTITDDQGSRFGARHSAITTTPQLDAEHRAIPPLPRTRREHQSALSLSEDNCGRSACENKRDQHP
ncbi:hypothetical protein RN629_07040 [Sphingomonadaceae bacterium jetA1]|jgi:hypothetical protein|uniref:hypothetical protein n=1 Tax=Facivitalis istanbulensis TaxID=3075838 RepID=UPI00347FAEEE